MPSSTRKQHNTIAKAAHDKEFAKKMGIPQKVAEEMLEADKRSGKFRKDKSKKR